jgi:sulfur carrier protein ThiS
MQINVFFDREKKEKTIEVGENSLIRDLLAKMNVNPVTVIVSRDGNIIMEDDEINDKDKINLISVISGG